MRTGNRKSAPEVTGGKVQKKNDWSLTPNYYSHDQRELVIDRKRPGKGYRHVLTRKDVQEFIAILPDWKELSLGLNAIVLAPGGDGLDGYHSYGVVHICAWEEKLWRKNERNTDFFRSHEPIFQWLSVPIEYSDDGYAVCKFEAETVRAYQLLHILLHELGHHHDRITTSSKKRASRGEPYAEAYALAYESQIWDDYRARFGLY
jgi:hypothetical protein